MNFLGHLHLSGNEPLVIVGNFMADAVKGRDLSGFHPDVRRGIVLHRTIDQLTDGHPMHRAGRERARTHAGRYAGVVMDLFYDHLLAEGWARWRGEPLPDFARRMYRLLAAHRDVLPERTRAMLPHMVRGDWLTSYATMDGLAGALAGLSRRAVRGGAMLGAERVLEEHLELYREEFAGFLADIMERVEGTA